MSYEEHMEKYIDAIPSDTDNNAMMAMVVIESRKYVKKQQQKNNKLEAENKALKEALTYIATGSNINRFSLQKKAKETLRILKNEG